jgi:hypothetical protein
MPYVVIREMPPNLSYEYEVEIITSYTTKEDAEYKCLVENYREKKTSHPCSTYRYEFVAEETENSDTKPIEQAMREIDDYYDEIIKRKIEAEKTKAEDKNNRKMQKLQVDELMLNKTLDDYEKQILQCLDADTMIYSSQRCEILHLIKFYILHRNNKRINRWYVENS